MYTCACTTAHTCAHTHANMHKHMHTHHTPYAQNPMHLPPPKCTRGRSFWREAGHRGLGNRMGDLALGTQKATGTSEPMDDSVSPVESALLTYVWIQSWTWGPSPGLLLSVPCCAQGWAAPPSLWPLPPCFRKQEHS